MAIVWVRYIVIYRKCAGEKYQSMNQDRHILAQQANLIPCNNVSDRIEDRYESWYLNTKLFVGKMQQSY
jgi:hypothetical protein